MAKKKSTVGRIGEAISDAASAVAGVADRNVVQPVGHALGLIDGKPKKTAKKKPKLASVKSAAKKGVAGKSVTKGKKAPSKKK